jgi:hypothetical protein
MDRAKGKEIFYCVWVADLHAGWGHGPCELWLVTERRSTSGRGTTRRGPRPWASATPCRLGSPRHRPHRFRLDSLPASLFSTSFSFSLPPIAQHVYSTSLYIRTCGRLQAKWLVVFIYILFYTLAAEYTGHLYRLETGYNIRFSNNTLISETESLNL